MSQREHQSLQEIFESQRAALGLALKGAPLDEILNVLLRCLEVQAEKDQHKIWAAIILVDDENFLRHGAAPSLPVEFTQSLKGFSVTAVEKLARSYGLHTCFSEQILSQNGDALGRFVIYLDHDGETTARDKELVELLTPTAALMIERDRAQGGRRKIEAEVERARRQLSDVFAQAPVAICVMEGPDHRITFTNAAFYQIYPIDRARIHGYSLRDSSETDQQTAAFVTLLDQVYQSGEPHIGSEAPSRKTLLDGRETIIYVNFIYQPKLNAAGDVDGIICVFTDVSEQVMNRRAVEKAKLEVENERENFYNLFTQTPELVCVLRGPDLHFEFSNEAHQRIVEKDVLGMSLRQAQPESVELIEFVDKVYRSGVTTELIEIGIHIGAAVRYFNLTISARMDSDGVIDGVMVLGAEVTEQIAIRKEAKSQQRWLETILNRLPIGLFMMNPATGLVTFANAAAEQMMGSTPSGSGPSDNISRAQLEIFEKYGQRLNLDQTPATRALRGENMQNEEFNIKGTTGNYSVAISSATLPPMYGQPATALMLMQDISQIKAAQDAAEAANSAKSTFLAHMSHEIRTPLGAIIGFLELMKNPTLPREELASYVQVIDRNSDQLLRLIDDILDLSKVEAGKMIFEKIEFSMRELLSDFSKMMSFKAHDKGIQYKIRLTSEVPEKLVSDPTRLRQILTNVVGNAIKFTEQGYVQVDIGFFEDELRMTVTDTGRGISKEQSEKLFRPFAQADSSTTRAFGGTGLGLVLSRRLANAMGGDFILQRSELGAGSVFFATVKLDLCVDSEWMPKGELHEHIQPTVQADVTQVLAGMSILVVEDALDNQALLQIMLSRLGAQISIGSDGKEGVDMARRSAYDIVLMDVQMPVMDGHEATRRLRRESFAKPIIALTAHAMKEERERCEASGFTDFLTKPIHQDSLVQMLLRYRSH